MRIARDPSLTRAGRAPRAVTLVTVALLGLALAQPAAVAQNGPKERAKREFELGKAAFGAGDFDEALQRYRRAYELVPLPGLLFNIAQCHRNLGNHRQAINFFRLYLAKVPNAPNRAAVVTLLGELERQAGHEPQQRDEPPDPGGGGGEHTSEQTSPGIDGGDQRNARGGQDILPPIDRPPPPPRRPFYAKWWFWTAVAAAIGGGAVGIYFGARSSSGLPDSRFPVFDVSVK